VSSRLVNDSRYWAEQMGREIVARASQKVPHPAIAPNIWFDIVSADETGVNVQVHVDTSEEKGSPFARAFEYGSGLRATRAETSPKQEGSRGFIIIRPKNAPQLIFAGTNEWEGLTIRVPPMGGGVVHHPGVAPQPYLHPAIEAVRIKYKRLMRKGLMDSIKLTFTRDFWNSGAPIG